MCIYQNKKINKLALEEASFKLLRVQHLNPKAKIPVFLKK